MYCLKLSNLRPDAAGKMLRARSARSLRAMNWKMITGVPFLTVKTALPEDRRAWYRGLCPGAGFACHYRMPVPGKVGAPWQHHPPVIAFEPCIRFCVCHSDLNIT